MKTRDFIIPFLVLLLAGSYLTNPVSAGLLSNLPGAVGQLLPNAPNILNSLSAPPARLWIAPGVPAQLRQEALAWGIALADEPASAALQLGVASGTAVDAAWVYALVAPFPTVPDGVTYNELLSSWKGLGAGPFAGRPLLMDASTLAAFTEIWGPPSPGAVEAVAADGLVDATWNQRPSWAIVPFETLDPHWKVLTIDGQSPIRKDFELYRYHLLQASFDYPLLVNFRLTCSAPCPVAPLPTLTSLNRDPARLTTLVMTGVTALVRATAHTMDAKGITYPGRDIRDWLTTADVTHISNEVPFAQGCPRPDPRQTRLVFCSDPAYMELLNYVGTDVVELTGNHYADYGPEAMLLTLNMYQANNMLYYGGGSDLQDARKPLLLQNHGNKLAFLGCNSVDVGRLPTATATRPGAAPCDYDYMTAQIRQLHQQGYIVISSFQYYERYASTPFDAQVHDFRLMADAGANIVQGSQAHTPESMEFFGGGFIHYGLGNLFFDQMGDGGDVPTRQEFIDRHVLYDGRYISTELMAAELEDFARPRPMTPSERAAFLAEYFEASGW